VVGMASSISSNFRRLVHLRMLYSSDHQDVKPNMEEGKMTTENFERLLPLLATRDVEMSDKFNRLFYLHLTLGLPRCPAFFVESDLQTPMVMCHGKM
jgi:hypothetical protein